MHTGHLCVVFLVVGSVLGATEPWNDDALDSIGMIELFQAGEATPEPTPVLEESSSNTTTTEVTEPWIPLIEPLIHTCPMDCNYRGICNLGYCECRYPYIGRACEKEMCGFNQTCNDRGQCVENHVSKSPSHVCLCDDGWTGPYCDERDDDCPYACLNHGTCDDGVCICNKGWSGDYCQEFFCVDSCSGHGECLHDELLGGYCNCTEPWYTETCHIAHCPRNCSGNGVCDSSTGLCGCNDTYTGLACDLRLCPNNCTYPQGLCNMTWGACMCEPLYRGADCSDMLCPNLCSGHGECRHNGTCGCLDGWAGIDCNTDLCWHNCSYHGTCDRTGACACHLDFTGTLCDIDLRCPNNCSNHGWCDDARCNCTGGWSSWDCSVSPFTCPNDFDCVNGNCSSGVCECERGWRDYDCSLPVVRLCTSNQDCDHGTCDDLGQCVCAWPWTGDFCERYMAFPLPQPVNGVYDIPDPATDDTALVREAKLQGFDEQLVPGRCGKFGGERCASPIYRRPHPLTPNVRIPMGIRHSENRAKANATHAANGTFWGDIWGNATEMWEEIHRQEKDHAEAAAAEAEKNQEAAAAAAEAAQSSTSETTTATPADSPPIDPNHHTHANVQLHHNLQAARKHYNHARLLKRSATRLHEP